MDDLVVRVKSPAMTCPLCHELLDEATTIPLCLHTFCRKCIHDMLSVKDVDSCPVCNTDLGCSPINKLRPDHALQSLQDKIFPQKNKETEISRTMPPVAQPTERKERSLSSPVTLPRVTGRRVASFHTLASPFEEHSPKSDGPSKDCLTESKPAESPKKSGEGKAVISPQAILEESSMAQSAGSAHQVEETIEQTLAESFAIQISCAETEVQQHSASTFRASCPIVDPPELRDLALQLQQLLQQGSFTKDTFSEMKTILSQIEERSPSLYLGSARVLLRTNFWRDWEEYDETHSHLKAVSQYLKSPHEQTLLQMIASYDRQVKEVDALQAELATIEAEIAQLQAKRASLSESIAASDHRFEETYLQMEQEWDKQEERS